MSIRTAAALSAVAVSAGIAAAGELYFNGFETDTASWSGAARVSSGTDGIASSAGGWHGKSNAGSTFTTWGGYNYGAGNAVPTAFQAYTTSIDIFLDVGAGMANDTRFDFSSAVNNSGGTHRRDFIFNAGFYNDATGPGAGTDRFVISASTNSQPGSAFAKNPANGPIAISNTGWYTFTHTFYDNGGVLAVDMTIRDASNALVNNWTLSNPTDLIGGIGGNRYGWFAYNQLGTLAFDNARLTIDSVIIPLPSTGLLAGLGLLAVGARRRRA